MKIYVLPAVALAFFVALFVLAEVGFIPTERWCGDYVPSRGAPCSRDTTLVVEDGVAICRCNVEVQR